MTYQIKDIVGYEGLYQVDTNGDVWNFKFTKKRKIKAQLDNITGYLHVCLCKNNNKKTHKVHRLVAQAFISNPNNLPCINHKDECKTNNLVENLEWCDYKYNLEYSGIIEKLLSAGHKATSKAVLQYTLNGEFIKEYPSVSEASRQTGIAYQNISSCCQGKYSQTHGYKWEYK